MIQVMGRVYNASYKVNEKSGKGSVIFQVATANASSQKDGNNMYFTDCVAFTNSASATKDGKGIAERIQKYYGDSGKEGKHRGKPVVVFGRFQEREYTKQIEKVIEFEGKKLKVKFDVPVKTQQLVVDSIQFVPQWAGDDTVMEVGSETAGEAVVVEEVDGSTETTATKAKAVEAPVASNGNAVDDDPFSGADGESDPFAN